MPQDTISPKLSAARKAAWAFEEGEKGGKNKVVFLDTETTGLDDEAEAVEVAVVDTSGRLLFQSLIQPRKPSTPEAEAVHKLTTEALHRAPVFENIALALSNVLHGRIVVAYNADFDRRVLQQTATLAIAKTRYEPNIDHVATFEKYVMESTTWRCAMALFTEFRGGEYQRYPLNDALKACGLDNEFPHAAYGDAMATWKLVKHLAESNKR